MRKFVPVSRTVYLRDETDFNLHAVFVNEKTLSFVDSLQTKPFLSIISTGNTGSRDVRDGEKMSSYYTVHKQKITPNRRFTRGS